MTSQRDNSVGIVVKMPSSPSHPRQQRHPPVQPRDSQLWRPGGTGQRLHRQGGARQDDHLREPVCA